LQTQIKAPLILDPTLSLNFIELKYLFFYIFVINMAIVYCVNLSITMELSFYGIDCNLVLPYVTKIGDIINVVLQLNSETAK